MRALEVWSQRIDANAATPPHRHDCEEVVVVLDGEGTLTLQGTQRRFQSGDTLILPPNEVHQIVNTGQRPLRLLGIFNMAPVRAELSDGTPDRAAVADAPGPVGGRARGVSLAVLPSTFVVISWS